MPPSPSTRFETGLGEGSRAELGPHHPFHSSLKSHTDCRPRARGSASLCLSFPTCKMGLLLRTTSWCSPRSCLVQSRVTWSSQHSQSWEQGVAELRYFREEAGVRTTGEEA